MQITITATLTEEQTHILAKQKGFSLTKNETYTEDVTDEEGVTTQVEKTREVPTPQSEINEFIGSVYKSFIMNDAIGEFMKAGNTARNEAQRAEESVVLEIVDSSITVTIE